MSLRRPPQAAGMGHLLPGRLQMMPHYAHLCLLRRGRAHRSESIGHPTVRRRRCDSQAHLRRECAHWCGPRRRHSPGPDRVRPRARHRHSRCSWSSSAIQSQRLSISSHCFERGWILDSVLRKSIRGWRTLLFQTGNPGTACSPDVQPRGWSWTSMDTATRVLLGRDSCRSTAACYASRRELPFCRC